MDRVSLRIVRRAYERAALRTLLFSNRKCEADWIARAASLSTSRAVDVGDRRSSPTPSKSVSKTSLIIWLFLPARAPLYRSDKRRPSLMLSCTRGDFNGWVVASEAGFRPSLSLSSSSAAFKVLELRKREAHSDQFDDEISKSSKQAATSGLSSSTT